MINIKSNKKWALSILVLITVAITICFSFSANAAEVDSIRAKEQTTTESSKIDPIEATTPTDEYNNYTKIEKNDKSSNPNISVKASKFIGEYETKYLIYRKGAQPDWNHVVKVGEYAEDFGFVVQKDSAILSLKEDLTGSITIQIMGPSPFDLTWKEKDDNKTFLITCDSLGVEDEECPCYDDQLDPGHQVFILWLGDAGLALTKSSSPAPTEHTITFNSNNGESKSFTDTTDTDGSITMPDADTTWTAPEGKIFTGWASSTTATAPQWIAGASANFNADTSVYAVWEVPADYSSVDAAIASIPSDLTIYTDDSVAAVEAAVAAVVRGLPASQQAKVDAMAKAINDAVDGLVLKDADYSALNKAIADAEAIDKTKYTEASVKALDDAVAAGKAVVAAKYKIDNQDKVDAAATAINNAIAGLVEKSADYSAVDAAIASIPSDLTIYTDDSVAAVEAAVAAVVRGLPASQQAKVDAMAKAINDAVNGLVLKTYTVSFDSDGGTDVTPQTIKHGEKATKPSSDPTKEGYTFTGWYEVGATDPFDFANTPITADLTLKAHWTEVPVEVVTLSGHVYDKESHEPIAGVVVKFETAESNKVYSTTTDQDGFYKIENITKGQAGRLTFTKDGYVVEEKELSAEYMSKSHDDQDVPLDKTSPEPAPTPESESGSGSASGSAQTGDSFPGFAVIGLALLALVSGGYVIRRRVY